MPLRIPVAILFSLFVCTPSLAAEPATRPATLPVDPLAPLKAGNYRREITTPDGKVRSYRVHVPPAYDRAKPTPVVLAFHGAMMNAMHMASFTGLDKKSDEAGFVLVYPNGTGAGELILFFNAGAPPKPGGPVDDVLFTAKLLDDLQTVVTVDPRRVFATGISNGGMMSHLLAAQLSERIAAVAPVSGTLTLSDIHPNRPVPVLHIHGMADTIVPFDGPRGGTPKTMHFLSVQQTVDAWLKVDGCPAEPVKTEFPDKAMDGTTICKKVYGPGKDGTEVVLVEIANGGHTWPGVQPPVSFIGKSTHNLSANDVIWEFFQKHPMPLKKADAGK